MLEITYSQIEAVYELALTYGATAVVFAVIVVVLLSIIAGLLAAQLFTTGVNYRGIDR